MNVLVDTCIWARSLRIKPALHDPLVEEMGRLSESGRVRIIGAIRQEILSGAAPSARFEALKIQLQSFPDLLLEREDYERTAAFYNLCRSKGVQASNTDFLICSAAVRHRTPIFTTDNDFSHIARLLSIPLHVTGD